VAAERAAGFARAVGDYRLLGIAEQSRASLLGSLVGRQEEALQVFEEARRAAEAAGDLEILGWALGDLALIHMRRGEFDTSQLYFERGLDVAERQGNPLQIVVMTQYLAWLAFYRGNWDQARIELRRAEVIEREAGVAWMPLALTQGHLALAAGAPDEAARVLEGCVAKLERAGFLPALRWAQKLLAECDLVEGRPDVARSRLVPLLDRPGLEEPYVTDLLSVLAWAHLEVGNVVQAADGVAQAIGRMRTENERRGLVDALRVQAMVATRQERWADAERALEEGLALARRMPAPVRAAPSIRQRSQGGHVGVALLTTSTTVDACVPGQPTGVRCTRCAHLTRVAKGVRYRSRPVTQSPLGGSRGEAIGRHGHRVEAASSRGRLRPRRA
jgi:tetratricopeptide (TPR) repeat protein